MVKIPLKNFRAELGKNIVEGNPTDVFIGKIPEDNKTWLVDWTGFPHYTAHTDEYPNFNLSADPNYIESKTLVFEKVTKK